MTSILNNASRQILDEVMDAVITVDHQERVLLFNKAAEDIFQYKTQDILGSTFDRLLPSRYRDSHHQRFRAFVETGQSTRNMSNLGEIIGLRKNGHEFPAEASLSMIEVEGQKLLTVVLRDITNRKIVETGLQFLNRQYQLLLHATGEGIYGIDRQGHVTFFNRAAESMTGWNQEEIRGKFIHTIIHHTKVDGKPYPWEECRVREVLLDGMEHHVTDEVLWRKDGSSFHVAYRSNPIRDEKRQIIGAVVAFQDITEQKTHHLKILALANRNQALLDAIPDMVVEIDTHKTMTWLNQAALDFYGPAAIGKEPKSFIVGEDNIYDRVQPIFEGHEAVIHLDSCQRRQDGQERLLEWWCRSLKDGGGQVIGAISTARDVTERKREAERLIESEMRFRTMVEHLPDGAVFTDGDGMLVNQAVVQMIGYSKEELSTLDEWFRLVHGPDESILRKLYQQDKQSGFGRTRLLPVHRKDGSLLYIEFSRYGWSGGEVWLLHDVTDEHEAKIALLANKSALEQSQKDLRSLTAKLLTAQEDERRRLSRDLHDDMNQRLAVLGLKIQTAQRSFSEPCVSCTVLRDLYDEVASLSDDVRHLAYQLHPSILDDLGLKLALQSLVDDFLKWEKIPITFIADQVPAMLPQEINSCLYRLAQESLRNISKYAQATEVTMTLGLVNGGLQLEIEDNGVGFEVDGSQLKKGLGLIGMQERIRMVKGTWSVVSHPGDGVTVTAWVPLPEGTQ